MKKYYPAGPQEKEELSRRAEIVVRILYGFLILVILFFVAMAIPFNGYDVWFFLTVIFCGAMFLLFQGIIHFARAKFNKYLAQDRLVFYYGIVSDKASVWRGNMRDGYRIVLDGERVIVDGYDRGQIKVGESFALLKWDQQDLRIESAVGDAAIAALRAKRNLF